MGCRVDVHITNLTRSCISNFVFDFGLGGPIAPTEGAPASRRAFDGELLPGDSVDWSTTFSILEFGVIIFPPCIVIPAIKSDESALLTSKDDWEIPGGNTNGVQITKENTINSVSEQPNQQCTSQQNNSFNCRPYVLGIESLMRPTSIDMTTFARYWSAAKCSHVVEGVWESESKRNKTKSAQTFPNVFEDPFKLQFALVTSCESSVIGGILSAGYCAPTASKDIVCLNISAFEIESVRPSSGRWSVKFEFRSDSRCVIDFLRRIPLGTRWFRQIISHRSQNLGVSRMPDASESEDEARSALRRWRKITNHV